MKHKVSHSGMKRIGIITAAIIYAVVIVPIILIIGLVMQQTYLLFLWVFNPKKYKEHQEQLDKAHEIAFLD